MWNRKTDKLSKTESLLINSNIDKSNLFRLKLTLPVVMVLSLAHIIIFISKLSPDSSIEHTWRMGIIMCHSVLFVIAGFSLLFVLKFRGEQLGTSLSFKLTTNALFLLTLIIGTVLTVFDQYVTTAITPFLIVSIALPIIISLPYVNTLFYYIIAYLLFVFLIPGVQKNSDVVLSNDVNAITAVCIGFVISFTYRKLNSDKFRKEIIINKQQEELQQQYEKLVLSSDELLHSNQIKDKFFSIIAHDLKSPFTGILGLTKLLNESAHELSPNEISEYSALLSNSALSLYSLLDNLLEWSRMQRGITPFEPMEYEIMPLIQKCINILESGAVLKDITILNEVKPDTKAIFDFQMFYTVIRNLLSNAVKFSNRGGKVVIGSLEEPESITVFVKDNGIGLSPEIIKDLFQIDKKVSRPGTEGESSTGLGLLVCKEYVEKHNGKLWVESIENQGSTFFVQLPATDL